MLFWQIWSNSLKSLKLSGTNTPRPKEHIAVHSLVCIAIQRWEEYTLTPENIIAKIQVAVSKL